MTHKAKKNLGQNFLKSKEALFKICEASGLNDKDTVVEIGPGKGALTEKLLEKAKLVIAIEKDRDLMAILEEKFESEIKNKKLILLNEDILEFDPLPLLRGGVGRGELIKNLPSFPSLVRRGGINPYKVIANIPYNITGLILRKFLSENPKPISMTLLVQKEVAERIVARDGKESILSLSVKAYGTPKYIMKVHKRFFSPAPKVDSAIIHIGDISNKHFKNKNEEDSFFQLIKAGFAHKRKVLRKNLEDLTYLEVGPALSAGRLPKIDEIFEKLNINPKARAEDIKFEKWIEILGYLENKLYY
ncbi:MAG: 16S rRNA (adenine(1518)-N(6)/adenine(1519)-N(6))-dimethyltransferase RsmA [Candidatus Paceibacterota bacterium]|jgi:16S rRNA (adenine1518-N6/adenine1519-N6)-dimethyltransferase